MSVYYVGQTTQFYHHELDASGGALPQNAGRWRSSNTAVATIDAATGLASWVAPGETIIEYVLSDYRRAGFKLATVQSAIPAILDALPSSISVFAGSVQLVSVTAFDSGFDAIADFALDSATSDDDSIATVVPIGDSQFFVVGVAEGACHIDLAAGPATLSLDVDVTVNNITQAQADARYRRLSVLINSSEIFRVPRVTLSDASGAQAVAWTRSASAVAFKLAGDTVTTVSDLPVDEFLFMDIYQDDVVGHHAWSLLADPSLPPLRWDNNDTPPDLTLAGARTMNSVMLYNDGINVVASPTWRDVPSA
jgi:hypothetical protein